MSVVAGDSAVIGTMEYRLHLARLLDPGGDPIELPVIGRFHVCRAPCSRGPTGT